jgi:hypothetical protein
VQNKNWKNQCEKILNFMRNNWLIGYGYWINHKMDVSSMNNLVTDYKLTKLDTYVFYFLLIDV